MRARLSTAKLLAVNSWEAEHVAVAWTNEASPLESLPSGVPRPLQELTGYVPPIDADRLRLGRLQLNREPSTATANFVFVCWSSQTKEQLDRRRGWREITPNQPTALHCPRSEMTSVRAAPDGCVRSPDIRGNTHIIALTGQRRCAVCIDCPSRNDALYRNLSVGLCQSSSLASKSVVRLAGNGTPKWPTGPPAHSRLLWELWP